MSRDEILYKLSDALAKNIRNEYQVIYILSRIRKFIELQDIRRDYKFLDFYCNWALHSKLDRTRAVAEVLQEFITGRDDGRFLRFDHLKEELTRFLNEYGLHRKTVDDNKNYCRFIRLLVNIYSDTPVKVLLDHRWATITVLKPRRMRKSKGLNFEVPYTVEWQR